ncbi:MAG: hypothetical protein RR922_05815 [Clostridia bacterium]
MSDSDSYYAGSTDYTDPTVIKVILMYMNHSDRITCIKETYNISYEEAENICYGKRPDAIVLELIRRKII